MITICCTAKLLKNKGFPIETSPPEPTNALGNWYANMFTIYHAQLLLFVSEKSRLAVITTAKEARTKALDYLTYSLDMLLRNLDAEPAWIKREIHEMSPLYYAKTNSRSILSTMNDFKYQIEAMAYSGEEMSVLEMSLQLSVCPIGQKDYFFPNKLTLELLKARYAAG